MGISGFNTFLRYLILFLCLATFSFDMYFVYVHHEYSDVVFRWKFYTQTSVVGSLFWIILLSEIFYRIEINSRRRRQYEYDYQNHVSYLPSSHQQDSTTTSSENMHPKPADTTIIPADRKSPSRQRTFWTVMRFLSVWTISAALLNLSITSFQHQDRSVFPLPFPRNSDDGEDLGDRYGYYDPQDLFSCQDIDVSDLRTTLCHFNQLTMILSALIGLVVILEGVLTFIIETRSHTHPSLNKSLTKKRAEHYEESELGNAQVVVPMSPRPFSEPYPYGVDSQNASLPNPGQFELDERPLPDLPDWNGKKLPVPDYSSDVKNPFASDLKDSKHAWAGSEGKDESNDYTQDIAGPSNTFPEDVKHKDGH